MASSLWFHCYLGLLMLVWFMCFSLLLSFGASISGFSFGIISFWLVGLICSAWLLAGTSWFCCLAYFTHFYCYPFFDGILLECLALNPYHIIMSYWFLVGWLKWGSYSAIQAKVCWEYFSYRLVLLIITLFTFLISSWVFSAAETMTCGIVSSHTFCYVTSITDANSWVNIASVWDSSNYFLLVNACGLCAAYLTCCSYYSLITYLGNFYNLHYLLYNWWYNIFPYYGWKSACSSITMFVTSHVIWLQLLLSDMYGKCTTSYYTNLLNYFYFYLLIFGISLVYFLVNFYLLSNLLFSVLAGHFLSFLETSSRFVQGPILVGKAVLKITTLILSFFVFSMLLGGFVLVLSSDIRLLGSFLTFLVALSSSSELEVPLSTYFLFLILTRSPLCGF